MKILSKLMLLALPVLASCGGNSGESCAIDANLNKTCTANVSHALPEGIWNGASSGGLAVQTLVLENGQYFVSSTSNGIFAGLIEGVMTATDGTFTDSAAVAVSSNGGVQATTLSGTFTAKSSFTASGGLQFNGNYNAAYDTPLAVTDLLGTWNNTATTQTSITFAGDGSLTGIEGGCTFTGTVKPRSTGKHVLDGTLTFTNAACPIGLNISTPVEATVINGQLTMVGVTPQRTAGFYLSATR